MTLISLEVQDVERDYRPIDLSSFDAETVMEWTKFFLTEREGWEGEPKHLHSYFDVGWQSYRVEATFHTPKSFARMFLGLPS